MYLRRETKKARRTLVLSAFVIFLGEILAGFMIDRTPLKYRFPEVPRIVSSALERGHSPEIVFLGGSRFGNLVNAKIIEQELAKATSKGTPFVLNASVPAGGPETFDLVVGKLLNAAVRPSIAVIEVTPETISRRNFLLSYHLARQFTWAEVANSLSDVFYSREVPRLVSTRLIPVYFFRREFRQYLFEATGLEVLLCCPNPTNNPPKTDALADVDTTSPARLVRGTKATRNRLKRFQIDGSAPRALERVLERYKALGVTTILLGVPISSPARAEYVSKIDAAYRAYIQKLKEIYGIHFVDYRDRLPDALFQTAYYTSPKGSLYASRLFAHEVLAPLWRNHSAANGGFVSRNNVTRLSDVGGNAHWQIDEDGEE